MPTTWPLLPQPPEPASALSMPCRSLASWLTLELSAPAVEASAAGFGEPDAAALCSASAMSSASKLIALSAQTSSAFSGVPSVADSSWPNTWLETGACTASSGPVTRYCVAGGGGGGGGLSIGGVSTPPPPPHAVNATVAAEAVERSSFLSIL